MWALILQSKIVRQAIAVGFLLLGFLAVLKRSEYKGATRERLKQERKDADNAKAIRKRVDAVPPGKLRPDDKRGYRD